MARQEVSRTTHIEEGELRVTHENAILTNITDNHQRMVVLAFDEMTIKGIWFIKLIYCDYMLNLISRHLTIEFRGQNTLSKYINQKRP